MKDTSRKNIPWQIWIVVVLLALEGVDDVLSMSDLFVAAFWIAAKCLFIVGLTRRSKCVFVLFLIIAAFHVLVFSSQAFFTAFVNLALFVLTFSAVRHYFPMKAGGQDVVP